MGSEDFPKMEYRNKKEMYDQLAVQVKGIADFPNHKIVPSLNTSIILSNISALLFYELNRFANPTATLQNPPINWLGFYLLQSPELLVLGPFQGRPACVEIKVGRGVCGIAAKTGEIQIISDVHAFPDHIACDSTSNAEIVLPIKNDFGNVVGVIDVDSTILNFFDEEDSQGLQEIASILSKYVEFPLSRILMTNSLLGNINKIENSNIINTKLKINESTDLTIKTIPLQSESKLSAIVINTPKTVIASEIEKSSNNEIEPRQWSANTGGWEFTATEFTRILTQDELRQYEEELGIGAIPEIQFAFNTLKIAPIAHPNFTILKFSLLELLRSAAEFYCTDDYRLWVAPQLTIPVAESWKNTPYATFDPKVDWAWRNNFFGINKEKCKLKSLEPLMPGVNWELLKDQTLPIIFFHDFDMMEDDLHDHGIVKSSVRIRAMPIAFFILFRHFIRIDGYRVWMREVRIFNEYAVKRSNGEPHIVVREEIRVLDIADKENLRDLTPNEYARDSTVVEANDFYIEFKDTADSEWWSSIAAS